MRTDARANAPKTRNLRPIASPWMLLAVVVIVVVAPHSLNVLQSFGKAAALLLAFHAGRTGR